MIILDTNVVSALMREQPDAQVVNWLDNEPTSSIWITSITMMEIIFGLQTMAPGRRRESMKKSFELVLEKKIEDRIAPFDAAAGRQAADLMAIRKRKGRPGEIRDTMIAGIVLASHATLVTRNTSHFEDITVSIINPWSV